MMIFMMFISVLNRAPGLSRRGQEWVRLRGRILPRLDLPGPDQGSHLPLRDRRVRLCWQHYRVVHLDSTLEIRVFCKMFEKSFHTTFTTG